MLTTTSEEKEHRDGMRRNTQEVTDIGNILFPKMDDVHFIINYVTMHFACEGTVNIAYQESRFKSLNMSLSNLIIMEIQPFH